jgi:uncharacterized damage-inducible protein DinB
MNPYFTRLYTYNLWANETLISLLETTLPNDEQILKALSHEVAALEIWYSRIAGKPARVNGVWEVYDLAKCRALNNEVSADWLEMIPAMQPEDYKRIIAYKNTAGNYYETPVIDIMGHAINHATYHRAQIASLIRSKGFTPVNTDFITYARLFSLPE